MDDVIGQIRNRHDLYQKNIYELELAKCAVINSLYKHEAYHGPADSKVEYTENAQQYLSAYRKVSILEDDKGDGP